jgi:hypothetical protein
MSRQHAEIEQTCRERCGKHDTLAVGTFADGGATFHGTEVRLDEPVTNYFSDDRLPRWKERPNRPSAQVR